MISLVSLDPVMSRPRQISNAESAIYLIRGQRVMLDSDLAAIDEITTKRLNEQLRRNLKRFPGDFAFQLTAEALRNLRSQIATSGLAAMWERPQCRDHNDGKSIGTLRSLPHF